MLSLLIIPLVATVIASSAGAVDVPQTPAPKPVVVVVAPEGETQEIVLIDGTTFVGRVDRVEGSRVTLRTAAGTTMDVEMSQIRSVKPFTDRIVNGERWRADANPTRLFFAPTGRSLKKGEAYFGMFEVFLAGAQVGVTDRVSVGAGTLAYPLGSEQPLWFTPKVQVVKSRSINAAIGVLHFANIADFKMGIAYGVLTAGSTDSAITVGGGYAYMRSDEDGDMGGAPVVMLGGEHRVGRSIKLVTENYIFTDGGVGLVSGGIRLLGEKLSVDLGFFSGVGSDGMSRPFPMVNFVWKF